CLFFFFQAEDGIRYRNVTGVQTCALPISFGDIFLSQSPDMEFWGRHRHVMSKSSNWWENVKIGGGAAPIETSEGWLLFYHGVTGTCNGYVYSIGGAILDRDDPSKVLYRCGNFLLTPE